MNRNYTENPLSEVAHDILADAVRDGSVTFLAHHSRGPLVFKKLEAMGLLRKVTSVRGRPRIYIPTPEGRSMIRAAKEGK